VLTGWRTAGKADTGKKRPHKKTIGNLKKFERVCASKISVTETAMSRPRKVEVTAIIRMAGKTTLHATMDRSTINAAINMGMHALTNPKKKAPAVFANTRSSSEIGASSKRSNERLFFSKVMATANMEVVPKKTDSDIKPGRIDKKSGEALSVLMKNMPAQDKGKIIPQLMFGGFK